MEWMILTYCEHCGAYFRAEQCDRDDEGVVVLPPHRCLIGTATTIREGERAHPSFGVGFDDEDLGLVVEHLEPITPQRDPNQLQLPEEPF